MSDSLDKAKGAIDAARELKPDDPQYVDLLTIARVQAEIAQAEALERLADRLDHMAIDASDDYGDRSALRVFVR